MDNTWWLTAGVEGRTRLVGLFTTLANRTQQLVGHLGENQPTRVESGAQKWIRNKRNGQWVETQIYGQGDDPLRSVFQQYFATTHLYLEFGKFFKICQSHFSKRWSTEAGGCLPSLSEKRLPLSTLQSQPSSFGFTKTIPNHHPLPSKQKELLWRWKWAQYLQHSPGDAEVLTCCA